MLKAITLNYFLYKTRALLGSRLKVEAFDFVLIQFAMYFINIRKHIAKTNYTQLLLDLSNKRTYEISALQVLCFEKIVNEEVKLNNQNQYFNLEVHTSILQFRWVPIIVMRFIPLLAPEVLSAFCSEKAKPTPGQIDF